MKFMSEAMKYRDKMIEYRRYLHRNPELSFHEENTARFIREELGKLGLAPLKEVRGNSTAVVIDTGKPGPTLLFRADIDALPIHEETGLEFASVSPGVMHACGHDAHTAALLCFARHVLENVDTLCGRVKLVFQQGEEQLPGGGSMIVQDGVLDNVDYVFAWHCAPEAEVGQLVTQAGPRTAAFGNFIIELTGRGGHSGFPHMAVNPISAGAEIVSDINRITGSIINPQDSAVAVVSSFKAGQTGRYNIIPETAVIEGNIRTLGNGVMSAIFDKIEAVAMGISGAWGCACKFTRIEGHGSVVNDLALTGRIKAAFERAGINAVGAPPIMSSEDFSAYTGKRPGMFLNVGTQDPKHPETALPPHNPRFCISEEAMVYALEAMMAVLAEMTKSEE